jgi:hypothetical protein
VLCRYITESDSETLQAHLLSLDKCKVLCDIYLILQLPHSAQELLSSEHTPTTSHAIPVYKMLIVTTKMATPLSSDSELTDVQLELCMRATKALEGKGREKGVPLRPKG